MVALGVISSNVSYHAEALVASIWAWDRFGNSGCDVGRGFGTGMVVIAEWSEF